MKSNTPTHFLRPFCLKGLVAMFLVVCSAPAFAQNNQLSLADILIALRSKKASLPDRNKILTDAIATRGTTFTLTPEIEKELSTTGADKALLDSIRQRSRIAKVLPAPPASTDPKPRIEIKKTEPVTAPSPAPIDFAFYEKRAGETVARGEVDAAIVDYTKAIEMNPAATKALLGRANCYMAKNAYALAITDLTKVTELDPHNAGAFAKRAEAHEKRSEADLALEDYKKANELDPTIEAAKTAVDKWKAKVQADEAVKTAALEAAAKTAALEAAAKTAVPEAPLPEFVELGQLTENQAIRLVKPVYPSMALQTHATGQVALDVELDTDGNVTKAKVVSGPQYLRLASEEAARRSKFKPAKVGDKAVKARGRLVYNFVLKS